MSKSGSISFIFRLNFHRCFTKAILRATIFPLSVIPKCKLIEFIRISFLREKNTLSVSSKIKSVTTNPFEAKRLAVFTMARSIPAGTSNREERIRICLFKSGRFTIFDKV